MWRQGVTELLHRELTNKIIRVYYDVYNGLSRTYPEFIYENAMMRDLANFHAERLDLVFMKEEGTL